MLNNIKFHTHLKIAFIANPYTISYSKQNLSNIIKNTNSWPAITRLQYCHYQHCVFPRNPCRNVPKYNHEKAKFSAHCDKRIMYMSNQSNRTNCSKNK